MNDQPRPTWTRFRVGLLLVVTAAVLIGGYVAVERTPFKNVPPRPLTAEVQARVAEKYMGQSGNFSDWALALLAGVIAISITTKVHKAPHSERWYILLGPAGAFLLMSLRAGWQFHRRLSNLVALDDLSDLQSLATLLITQWTLFFLGLACASAFALRYLVSIVSGYVKPHD